MTTELNTINTDNLLLKAVESNLPVESLEKLLAMQERINADMAKKAFFAALSAFQSECPQIEKKREVKEKGSSAVRYRYASLDDIIKQVAPLLQKHGFSYTVQSECRESVIAAICKVHHINGHSEESFFSVPVEETRFMNDAQKAGSAQTYAKRYAFCNAFGIVTSDLDDDGRSAGNGVDVNQIYRNATYHMKAVFNNLDTIVAMKEFLAKGMIDEAAEAWSEITDAKELSALTLAPTKGGCFTVEEKGQMNTEEFKAAIAAYRKDRPLENL